MKTIVVAEDFHASRKVIVNALVRRGYKALEAADGEEALGLFDGRNIDLLVTDHHMPKMNGTALVEAVRMRTQYKSIPAVVLSAAAMPEQSPLLPQHTAWVPKPFDLERFIKLVEQSMKR